VGLASRKAGDSLRTEHLFELASVSKQFTAVAVLQLVEQGKIKLTDSLQQYFPDFPHRGITVHMLLCHRGGLSNYMYDLDRLWPDHSEYPNNQSMLQLITEQPQQPFFPPDRRYLKKHIFEPAGMKTAFLMQAGKDLPELALKGYSGGREITPNYFLNGVVGDKGIYASVHDLYAWEKALFNQVLISEKSMQMALQPYNPERKKSNYGYGWRMYNLPSGRTVYFHGGWWRGFKTLLVHLPDDHTTIIGLSNRTSGAYLNKGAILSILYGGEAVADEAEE
jgi:CubicO group peptidase (beta-lactamase class C family)